MKLKYFLYFILIFNVHISLFANDKEIITKVYCGYDINDNFESIYKDNNVYYNTRNRKRVLFLNFRGFGVESTKASEDKEWVLVTAYSGNHPVLFLFNIPYKKYIDLDKYGSLTYWMDKDEKGEFIGVDCRLKPNCSNIEYKGVSAYKKVYFKYLKMNIDHFKSAYKSIMEKDKFLNSD